MVLNKVFYCIFVNTMKQFNPLLILFLGSASVAVSLCGLLLAAYFLELSFWSSFALVIIGTTCITFGIFFFFFYKFIYNRLKILYRTIRSSKTVKGEKLKINLRDDLIGKAEIEASTWKNNQAKELDELRKYDSLRREFIGNLAHELKTPLFSIQGYVHTLLDGGVDDPSINKNFLERAANSIERMEHILNDLDQLNAFENETVKLNVRPFNLKVLCSEIMESFEFIAKAKNINLEFEKEHEKEFMVLADRSKIAQVLTNLIQNSISYGSENGKTQLRFYEVDDIVTVEVSDNGSGIEPHEVSRIFERFYRIEKSRTRNEGGSGLGLSIAKHIIEAHNQIISVRSTVGVGSTFTFSLDLFDGKTQGLISSRGVPIK